MRENRQCQQPAWNDAGLALPSNAERTAAHVTRCAPEQAQQPRIAQAVPRKTVPKKLRSRAAQQIEHARAHANAAAKAKEVVGADAVPHANTVAVGTRPCQRARARKRPWQQPLRD